MKTTKNPAAVELVRGTRTYTLEEWRAEGERRFGQNQLLWCFVCPACGHVQCAENFRPFKAQGATVESAHFNCIGRYSVPKREAFGQGPGPCNYTGGGLFNLMPITVIRPTGEQVRCFDFAGPDRSKLQSE